MSEIERPCDRCGESFPLGLIERRVFSACGKFIYFCRDCVKELTREEDERRRQELAKAKTISRHLKWWDKSEYQKD